MKNKPLLSNRSAIVFAYHSVGVRCLETLLHAGIQVKLVVTHQDNPNEQIWFQSVRACAERYAIPCISPDDANHPTIVAQLAALQADFIFSFYYRQMLKQAVLACAIRGAYNLHGSLLPKYRGRVPINWAIIQGEQETGATLHVMNEKPDNGAIVAQMSVPILKNDDAAQVFNKVTVAAECILLAALPDLCAGTARFTEQDLSQGAYFGGRSAEDGRINWQQPAHAIHNLIRAVSHPFPGAFFDTHGLRIFVWQTQILTVIHNHANPQWRLINGQLFAYCQGGGILQIENWSILRDNQAQIGHTALFQTLFGEQLLLTHES